MNRFFLGGIQYKLLAIAILLFLCAFFLVMYTTHIAHQTQPNYQKIVTGSWDNYKKTYLQSDGRIIDFSSPILASTSEGQSYGLLRAAFVGDKKSFDLIYAWTQDNLGVRADGLYAWRWGKNSNGLWGITSDQQGYNSATDGDEQIATALLTAYKRWHDINYLKQAEKVIKSIYKSDTYTNASDIYIVGGNWANNSDNPLYIYINPSYLQIAAYKVFQKVDVTDAWQKVITSSYTVLGKCIDSQNTLHLPTNWCLLDKNGGVVISVQDYPPEYGYDSFRTFFNVAVDYQVNADMQDLRILHDAGNYFLQNTLQNDETPKTINVLTKKSSKQGSVALISGSIAALRYLNPQKALRIYEDVILGLYTKKSFGNGYYDENWNWFITALLGGKYATFLYNV